jgi:hypothetical protein
MIDNDGSDLIFLTGAPGSRWSSVHREMNQSPDINSSDVTKSRQYVHVATGNQLDSQPNHSGVYFGPSNGLGEKLGYLHDCSKEYMLNEFSKGFESFEGIKIIKSHWFSYNLPYLKNSFPKSKIILCYMSDMECFSWWHKAGGWGITYPNYTWYRDDARMLEKIKEENSNILKFGIDCGVTFSHLTVKQVLGSLNLRMGEKHWTDVHKCKIAIVH